MFVNAQNVREGKCFDRLNLICVLISILYTIPIYAYTSQTVTDLWIDSTHTTAAKNICESGCDSYCWLPNGTYYDVTGRFTERCGSLCRSGEYDIGFEQCINAGTGGIDYGYWSFSDGSFDAGSVLGNYGFTSRGEWAVDFNYGLVKGIASCNNTAGTYGVATDKEFSSTANGSYCWCKMTSPATSKWVYRYSNLTSGICEGWCVYRCAEYVDGDSEYRSGLFDAVEQPSALDQAYAQGLKDCAEP